MSSSSKILTAILTSIHDDALVSKVLNGIRWTAVVSKHCGLASGVPSGFPGTRGQMLLHSQIAESV